MAELMASTIPMQRNRYRFSDVSRAVALSDLLDHERHVLADALS
jgi:hypothetical protein